MPVDRQTPPQKSATGKKSNAQRRLVKGFTESPRPAFHQVFRESPLRSVMTA